MSSFDFQQFWNSPSPTEHPHYHIVRVAKLSYNQANPVNHSAPKNRNFLESHNHAITLFITKFSDFLYFSPNFVKKSSNFFSPPTKGKLPPWPKGLFLRKFSTKINGCWFIELSFNFFTGGGMFNEHCSMFKCYLFQPCLCGSSEEDDEKIRKSVAKKG